MDTGSVKEELLGIAAIREDVVGVSGKQFYVREVGALEFAEYGRMQKEDRVKATATLIAACVLDGPGGNPVLTVDDAITIAKSARVAMPIVTKIMELSGFGDDEKESNAS